MPKTPTLTVVAGQNGTGKSTLSRYSGIKAINPDEITRSIDPNYGAAANFQAGREVLRQQQEAIAQRRSFGIETTLASRQPLKLMEQAKAAGYDVKLVFVTLPENEVGTRLRIDNRVMEGGHNISDSDLERRAPRVLENFPQALKQADVAAIYVSNRSGNNFQMVGMKYEGQVTLTPQAPSQIRQALEQKMPVQMQDQIDPKHAINKEFNQKISRGMDY